VPIDRAAKPPVGDKPSSEGLETATFLGITFARATEALTKYYGHYPTDWFIVIEVGPEAGRFGLSDLVPGCALRSVSDPNWTRIGSGFSPVTIGWSILECIEKHPQQDAFQCQMGFKKPNAPEEDSSIISRIVDLTPADVETLRRVYRPLTLFGVTFETISAAARKEFSLQTSFSVMVADPGAGNERVGMKGLKRGDAVQFVSKPGSARGVFHPVDLVNAILEHLDEPAPGKGVKPCGMALARNFDPSTGRWESIDLELKLTDEDVQELKAAAAGH